MTRDDIIRMAREAFGAPYSSYLEKRSWDINDKQVERFAALVAAYTLSNIDPSKLMSFHEGYAAGVAAEREACAKICESLATDRGMFHPDDEELKIGVLAGAGMCGATIRARGAQ